jgi:DNA-binding MarR family transcriptional regulator
MSTVVDELPRLGPALRRAWIGYRRRLDAELAEAGFGDRAFPDGRVLRICSRSADPTISEIGRELAITRQGASKIVAGLRDRGYVTLRPSATDRREKVVELAPRAVEYLAAHRRAASKIERRLRDDVGGDAFDALHLLLEALGGKEQPRLSDYLRTTTHAEYLPDG